MFEPLPSDASKKFFAAHTSGNLSAAIFFPARGFERATGRTMGDGQVDHEHELRIIRVVLSIDSARDSQRCLKNSIATHEQSILEMTLMEGVLRTSIDLNRQINAQQEESISQNRRYLESLLKRPQ